MPQLEMLLHMMYAPSIQWRNGVCSYEVHVMQGPSCEGSLLLRIVGMSSCIAI